MPSWRDTLKLREAGERPGFANPNVPLEEQEAGLTAVDDAAFATVDEPVDEPASEEQQAKPSWFTR